MFSTNGTTFSGYAFDVHCALRTSTLFRSNSCPPCLCLCLDCLVSVDKLNSHTTGVRLNDFLKSTPSVSERTSQRTVPLKAPGLSESPHINTHQSNCRIVASSSVAVYFSVQFHFCEVTTPSSARAITLGIGRKLCQRSADCDDTAFLLKLPFCQYNFDATRIQFAQCFQFSWWGVSHCTAHTHTRKQSHGHTHTRTHSSPPAAVVVVVVYRFVPFDRNVRRVREFNSELFANPVHGLTLTERHGRK